MLRCAVKLDTYTTSLLFYLYSASKIEKWYLIFSKYFRSSKSTIKSTLALGLHFRHNIKYLKTVLTKVQLQVPPNHGPGSGRERRQRNRSGCSPCLLRHGGTSDTGDCSLYSTTIIHNYPGPWPCGYAYATAETQS